MTLRNLFFLAYVAAALAGCVTVSPGIQAASRGDAAQLQQILDQPNHGGEDLSKLLYYAAWGGNVDCARVMMRYVQAPAVYLASVALKGQEKMARLFIEHGTEPSEALAWLETNPQPYFTVNPITPGQLQIAKDLIGKLVREKAAASAASVAAADEEDSTDAADDAAEEPLRPRAAPLFHEAAHPDDYALVVGVEKYDGLPEATYAGRDAAAATDFVEALGVPASHVVTLTDSHATKSGLLKQLEGWLPNNVNENSTVYFYYSGHGAPDTKTGQAYLVPFDGDPEYLDQTAYPLKRAYEKLGALKAKRVIVMLDSCFSGAGGRSVLAKGSRPLVNNVDTGFASADGKIVALTASGADQISGTNDDSGHGLFTYHVLTGLNGAAQDAQGRVTLKSLFNYVKPKVMDDAHRANRDQVPQLQAGEAVADDVVLREK